MPVTTAESTLRDELEQLESKYAGPGCHLLRLKPGSEEWRRDHDRMTAIRESLGMQYWQKTRREVHIRYQMPAAAHKRAIVSAMKAGKNVPAEVLKDYPELLPESEQTLVGVG